MLSVLAVFVPTALLFAMIPGPDFAVILKTALLHGRRAGLAAALGIGSGLTVHTALCVLGLSAIIAHSPLLFGVITYAGAIYLSFLGIRALLARPVRAKADATAGAAGLAAQPVAMAQRTEEGFFAAFCTGFLTNVLNPKAILFFLTFLPQFVDRDSALGPHLQLLVLGAAMCIVTALWFALLSLLLDRFRTLFTDGPFRLWLERIAGAIFLGFGIRLAVHSS